MTPTMAKWLPPTRLPERSPGAQASTQGGPPDSTHPSREVRPVGGFAARPNVCTHQLTPTNIPPLHPEGEGRHLLTIPQNQAGTAPARTPHHRNGGLLARGPLRLRPQPSRMQPCKAFNSQASPPPPLMGPCCGRTRTLSLARLRGPLDLAIQSSS